jgi:hypothetical protein
MRKLLLAGAAAVALTAFVPTATMAEDFNKGVIVGGTAGAWTGGTIGFLLGGPIGAVIGGWTGAAIGATVLAHHGRNDDVAYGSFQVGDRVEGVRLRSISGEDRYGYFRADGYVYIVDRDTREIVEIREG